MGAGRFRFSPRATGITHRRAALSRGRRAANEPPGHPDPEVRPTLFARRFPVGQGRSSVRRFTNGSASPISFRGPHPGEPPTGWGARRILVAAPGLDTTRMAQCLQTSRAGVKASAAMSTRAARCGPLQPASQRGSPQVDSGPMSGRVGGESGVDDAGPPATDVSVHRPRAEKLRATKPSRRESLIAVGVLAAPYAP